MKIQAKGSLEKHLAFHLSKLKALNFCAFAINGILEKDRRHLEIPVHLIKLQSRENILLLTEVAYLLLPRSIFFYLTIFFNFCFQLDTSLVRVDIYGAQGGGATLLSLYWKNKMTYSSYAF